MSINTQIVIIGYYVPVLVGAVIDAAVSKLPTATEPTLVEQVAWAASISFIGGVSAAWRISDEWQVLLKSGLNTAILGISIVMVATHFTDDKPALQWGVIGVSGLLSLGGLATVDWAVKLTRKRVESRSSHDSRK